MVLTPSFGRVPLGQFLSDGLNHRDQVLGLCGELFRFPVVVLVLVHGPGLFPLKPEAKGTLTQGSIGPLGDEIVVGFLSFVTLPSVHIV